MPSLLDAPEPLQLPDPPDAPPNSDLWDAWKAKAEAFLASLQPGERGPGGEYVTASGMPVDRQAIADAVRTGWNVAGMFGDGGLAGITRRVRPPPIIREIPPDAPFTPVPRLSGVQTVMPGYADQVSTRVPTAVPKKGEIPLDPHGTADLRIGIDAMRASGDAFDKNMALLKTDQYPDLPLKGLRNPDSIAEASIGHMADNLTFLFQQLPLSRAMYIAKAWGPDKPEEWTAEHELEVPECFRNPDAVRPDPGKRGAAGPVAWD